MRKSRPVVAHVPLVVLLVLPYCLAQSAWTRVCKMVRF